MISIGGLSFLENEQIKSDEILTCHPQKMEKERIGVPLRVTVGYQCFYDKKLRTFQGMTFYAPSNSYLNGPPRDQFKYVLACIDGDLKTVNGELCLISGDKTIIYSHFLITKGSGKVKKGQIIGNVQAIPNGYGWGVSLRAYKGSTLWNIEKDYFNIPCVE